MAKNVERFVGPDLQAGILEPLREPAAPFQVGLAPGEPFDAAVGPSADRRELAKIRQEALAVDVASFEVDGGIEGLALQEASVARRRDDAAVVVYDLAAGDGGPDLPLHAEPFVGGESGAAVQLAL